MRKYLLLIIALFAFGFIQLSAQPVLYGVTSMGGSGDGGTLFQFDATTHILMVKKNFEKANGLKPFGKLLSASNGMLYGTTSEGGSLGYGTLFQYNPRTGAFTTKANFEYASTGAYSFGNLIEVTNGDIVGVCSSGGAGGYGTLWRYQISTNKLTKLKDFDAKTGAYPYSGAMLASNGKLYGVTTNYGPDRWGTLYEFDLKTNAFTLLQSFNSSNGAYGFGELAEVHEKLFGLTYLGGTNDQGTIFEYDLHAARFATRYNFDNGGNGGSPYGGGLILASNGRLYGTNTSGGQFETGILFSFDTRSGDVSKIYDFNNMGSGYSYSPVMQASDGNLYGMTNQGYHNGNYDDGSIYQFDMKSNRYATVLDFNKTTGTQPYWTGLTEAKPIKDTCEGNVAPVITAVKAPDAAQAISTNVRVDVGFVDTNVTAGSITWGDGTSSSGVLDGQTMTGTHAFGKPGIYTLKISLIDACKLEASTTWQYVVIFDPNSKCLSGAGRIDSPRNSCRDHRDEKGQGAFEMQVRYAKGGKKPVGHLEFSVKTNSDSEHEF